MALKQEFDQFFDDLNECFDEHLNLHEGKHNVMLNNEFEVTKLDRQSCEYGEFKKTLEIIHAWN